jgi:hypothetical protein
LMGSLILFARSKIFLTPDGRTLFTLSESTFYSFLRADLIDSAMRSNFDFGRPPKAIFSCSSVNRALRMGIISALSCQQPIMLRHGNPSLTEKQ